MVDGAGSTGPVAVSEATGSAAASALARCIGTGPEEFAACHWSRQPLLSPAAETGADFTDLLDESGIDELLSRRGLRTPFIRMAKQGKVIAAKAYTRPGGSGAGIGDQVADDLVLGQLADGATLVLQALHRNWPPLIEFGSMLAAELGHPVQINAYLTPPQNQGFDAHYDTHDVFVLQVSGRKRWLVHPPVIADPLPGQVWEQRRADVAARAAEPPLLEAVLGPGDALYLPRGFLHSAQAQGETSLHLTVGVHPVTRHAVLSQLLAEAAGAAELRGSLPMGTDLSDPAVLGPHLAEAVRALVEYAGGPRLPAVADRVGAELASATRPVPIAPLAQLAVLAGLAPDTELRLRPSLRLRVLTDDDGGLVLVALGHRVTLPAAGKAAITLIATGVPVRAGVLPGLDPDEQLDLVRRLVTAAVLIPVAHA